LQEVHLRRAANEEGHVKVLGPVSLSSFLEASLTAQRALSRRPAAPQRQQQQRGQGQQHRQRSSTVGSSSLPHRVSSDGDAEATDAQQGSEQQEQQVQQLAGQGSDSEQVLQQEMSGLQV
jgi:hypothetical protein